ncbi:MAG TPA: hypothetical protein PK887_06570 [Ignavibacteriales bacterium]|mgnify:CR=1 FL=1|nr:hypothetical protein [Ignavibacteriales bacterium]
MKIKILIINITLFLLFSDLYSQEVDCPKGRVNCTLKCGRYVDENNDTICDLSVPKIIKNEIIQVNEKKTDSREKKLKISNNLNLLSKNNKKDTGSITQSNSIKIIKEAPILPLLSEKNKPKYHLVQVSVITIFLYFLSKYLYHRKIISLMSHRQFWNTVLLLSFLFSGLLGLFLVIKINYDIKYELPFDIYLFHVDFGIMMAILSIIHAWWHLKYYKNYLIGNEKGNSK